MRSHRYPWALGAVLLASCYDYSTPNDVVNGAVVITQQSPTFNYANPSLRSYYLDPTAKVVKDNPQLPEQMPLPANVITAIDQNMQAAGYTTKLTTLPAAGTPDTVGVHVTLLQGTVNVYYPGYWCDYWYYYSCWYNWTYAGSYNTGTMIMEMGDLSAPVDPANPTLPVAWLAAIYGVAGNASYNATLAAQGVDRAFGQSPYLNH